MTMIVNKFAKYERFRSIDGEQRSVGVRIFFFKLANTGLIVLLMDSAPARKLFSTFESVANESARQTTREFSTDWYAKGGVELILIMVSQLHVARTMLYSLSVPARKLFNIGSPHMMPLLRYLRKSHYTRKMFAAGRESKNLRTEQEKNLKYITQDEINHAVMGPQFHLSMRYGQLLVTYYICLMYGTGIPLLYYIGCFSFAVTYWVDKWLFIRFYRSPPHYSEQISVRASKLTAYPALLVHLAMSIWILGNEEIFSSERSGVTTTRWFEDMFCGGAVDDDATNACGDPLWQTIASKVEQSHVVGLTVVLFVLIAFWLVYT